MSKKEKRKGKHMFGKAVYCCLRRTSQTLARKPRKRKQEQRRKQREEGKNEGTKKRERERERKRERERERQEAGMEGETVIPTQMQAANIPRSLMSTSP